MAIHVTIEPATSVVLVHDVVNDFLDLAGPGYDEALPAVLANVQATVEAARRAQVPVVFVGPGQGDLAIGPPPAAQPPSRLVWGSPGCDVPATLGPLPGDVMIRKPRWGGFYGSELAGYLHGAGRNTLVVCGLSLAGGVETTVRDAYNHDFQSIVVADACLTRAVPDQGWGAVSREEILKATLSVLAQRFARVATTAEICDELRQLSAVMGRA